MESTIYRKERAEKKCEHFVVVLVLPSSNQVVKISILAGQVDEG